MFSIHFDVNTGMQFLLCLCIFAFFSLAISLLGYVFVATI